MNFRDIIGLKTAPPAGAGGDFRQAMEASDVTAPPTAPGEVVPLKRYDPTAAAAEIDALIYEVTSLDGQIKQLFQVYREREAELQASRTEKLKKLQTAQADWEKFSGHLMQHRDATYDDFSE